MPDSLDAMTRVGPTEKLIDMFNKDASVQGLYVLPAMVQVMNMDGSVKESIVMNEDGTGTVTEGGVHGILPGAPGGFVELQGEKTRSSLMRQSDWLITIHLQPTPRETIRAGGMIISTSARPSARTCEVLFCEIMDLGLGQGRKEM
ncbi:hypothetical protein N431DRAFT_434512 [Stipitochalara longipes BDJ]|nr:hypothetical protein N431DRAFT_434512 [Stipitochalara longipes BDJ]